MSLKKFKIKEQLEAIKSQFDDQKSLIPAQSQALFTMMVQLIELLIIVFEEKFTPKDSHNSSIPPSKSKGDRKKKTRKGTPKKRDS